MPFLPRQPLRIWITELSPFGIPAVDPLRRPFTCCSLSFHTKGLSTVTNKQQPLLLRTPIVAKEVVFFPFVQPVMARLKGGVEKAISAVVDCLAGLSLLTVGKPFSNDTMDSMTFGRKNHCPFYVLSRVARGGSFSSYPQRQANKNALTSLVRAFLHRLHTGPKCLIFYRWGDVCVSEPLLRDCDGRTSTRRRR